MSALYSVADIRKIEQAAAARRPDISLMQQAGKSIAEAAMKLLGTGTEILVLAGPGNNGGDAFHAAHVLAAHQKSVTILLLDSPLANAECRAGLSLAEQAGARIIVGPDIAEVRDKSWHLVIDGLFGIGLSRPIPPDMHELINTVNAMDCPLLAIDVPSGLDADNGNVVGSYGAAIHASHTLTFIGDKPGLHTADGRDHAGRIEVNDLGIDASLYPDPTLFLIDPAMFIHALAPRKHNSHKGSHGSVSVGGGAEGMTGAVILAARAALQCGAGKVFAGFLYAPPAYDYAHPELMCRRAADLDLSNSIAVVGPGLGTDEAARALLTTALRAGSPLVLDADALNLLSQDGSLQAMLNERNPPAIITPHPLEAARLLQKSNREVQQNRIATARTLATKFNAIAILKGSGTVIAKPDGTVAINPTGNPSLATGGTGDVLAGVCGALLAQHMPPWEAALAAVWIHGKAGEVMAERLGGQIGLCASELIPAIRSELNRLTSLKSLR